MTASMLLKKARTAAASGDAFKAYIHLQDAKLMGNVSDKQIENIYHQLPLSARKRK